MNIELIIILVIIVIGIFIALSGLKSFIVDLQNQIRDLTKRIEKLENNESRNDNE